MNCVDSDFDFDFDFYDDDDDDDGERELMEKSVERFEIDFAIY